MTGGQLLLDCLRAQGVTTVFGQPGNQLAALYRALYEQRRGVRHITIRNEQAGAMMADGYARASGEAGVLLTVPGPGAANAAGGLVEAYTDCVPVLLITGQNDSRLLNHDPGKMFHGLDQERFMAPITGWRGRVTRAEEIPAAIHAIFAQFRNGRPRPAHLDIPQDILAAAVEGAPGPRVERTRQIPPAAEIERAALLLVGAARPLLLVGTGALWSGAVAEVRALAERLGAPVITTALAKGLLPEEHPLAGGDVRGRLARELLAGADLLLAVGVRFTQNDTAGWSMAIPAPLVQIDSEERELGAEYPAALGLAGDEQATLAQLLTALPAGGSARPGWSEAAGDPTGREPRLASLEALRAALPPEAILSVDVHWSGYRTRTQLPWRDPRRFLYPAVAVGLGYGLPAAIGARAACPDRPVVAFCGDGGFLLTGQELATAVQFDLPVTVVVVNDRCFTSIYEPYARVHSQDEYIGCELRNPDFLQYAAAFGVPGTRVETPAALQTALQQAIASGGPSLIEMPRLEERAA